jgi:hypothetical protein
MSVLIPKDIEPSEYSLNLMDINWIYKSNRKIKIYK